MLISLYGCVYAANYVQSFSHSSLRVCVFLLFSCNVHSCYPWMESCSLGICGPFSPNHTTRDYCTTVCLVCSSAFSVFSDHIGMSECAGVACLSQNSISFFHLLSRASFTFLALFSSSAVCFQFSCPFATSSDVLFHFSCLLTYHLTHQPGYVIAYVSFGYSDTYVCKEARETAY